MFFVVFLQLPCMKKCLLAGVNVADKPSCSTAIMFAMNSLQVPVKVTLFAVTVTTAILWTTKRYSNLLYRVFNIEAL